MPYFNNDETLNVAAKKLNETIKDHIEDEEAAEKLYEAKQNM